MLFGIAISTKNPLSLAFPPVFWKKLIGEEISLPDLEDSDVHFVQFLRELRSMASDPKLRSSSLEDILGSLMMESTRSDGSSCELIPGGSSIPLSWENVEVFIERALSLRSHESDAQFAAIRRGITIAIPEVNAVLVFLSPSQLEKAILGEPDVSITALQVFLGFLFLVYFLVLFSLFLLLFFSFFIFFFCCIRCCCFCSCC